MSERAAAGRTPGHSATVRDSGPGVTKQGEQTHRELRADVERARGAWEHCKSARGRLPQKDIPPAPPHTVSCVRLFDFI